MHRPKSQSAMEYLMTYGWAILIVAVVLGALFELGIFSGTTFGGNACIPASGYLCNNPVLSTNGLLSVSFGEVGYQITITGVSCSTNSTAPSSFQSADILMESGQIENLNFNCPLPSNQLDTPFSGYLFIEYNTLNYPTQVVRFATVATKALLSGAPSAASSSISNVPITLSNAQGVPTPAPFQQMISFDPSSYSSYESADLGNIRFYQGSTELYSWCESGCTNSSSDAVFWVNLPSGISANSNTVVNMDFESVGTNYDGVFAGEAPQLSPTYAEYDNGASVFLYYNVNPASTAGWTIAGQAGQTSSAPSGSHYGTTNALYANSARGDYLYTSIPALTTNVIVSFNVYTTGLGNVFFLTNPAGNGQMARLDSRGGSDYSGLATTSSWTLWTAPTGITESRDTWYKYDVVVSGTSAYAYIGSASESLATYGTPTSSSAFTVSNNGDYMGLVGDALGSSYITYWNGFVVRAYPPNGVMPTVTLGALS